MKRMLTGVVLIPLVLLAVFKAPLWLFMILVAIATLLAGWEYFAIAEKYAPGYKFFSLFLIAGFYIGMVLIQFTAAQYLSIAVILVVVVPAFLQPLFYLVLGLHEEDLRKSLLSAALSFLVIPYVVLPLGLLVLIKHAGNGWFLLLVLFSAVWSGDIFAYYVGKTFGRHKLAPRVSPNKSWEGAIASVAGSIVVVGLLFHYGPQMQIWLASHSIVPMPEFSASSTTPLLRIPRFWTILLFAILVNVAAQLGDLVESMLKRGAGVKDSGNILPGHGGILDRIDALLFATPVAAILFVVLQPYL